MTSADSSVRSSHSHHPNYWGVWLWLLVLTIVEVSIPEFIRLPSTGPDQATPVVVTAANYDAASQLGDEQFRTDLTEEDYAQALAAITPTERFAAIPWSAKIIALSVLALIKAGMVGMFFMHLKFEGWRINAVLAMPTVLFVIIMIMTFPDIAVNWPSLY